jgi:transketolase
MPSFEPGKKVATRAAWGSCLNVLKDALPHLMGGSADLDPSNQTAKFRDAVGIFASDNPTGRNLSFGVREFPMAAILNGMALHGGVVPFGATFLTFSDYCRNAIRMSALQKLPVLYVFTHDSFYVGEDGPTHQPIEHLAGLRGVPGLSVLRPADANETAEAWALAVQRNGPTALVLTRQNVAHLDRSNAKNPSVARGAYILSEPGDGRPDVILIGSGSEVELCVKAQDKLKSYGVKARVVSMPSWDLFDAQDESYRENVLPMNIKKRVTIEAATPVGWHRWAGDEGVVIGVEHFGASAPGPDVFAHLGITAEHVTAAALRTLGRNDEADREYNTEATPVPA